MRNKNIRKLSVALTTASMVMSPLAMAGTALALTPGDIESVVNQDGTATTVDPAGFATVLNGTAKYSKKTGVLSVEVGEAQLDLGGGNVLSVGDYVLVTENDADTKGYVMHVSSIGDPADGKVVVSGDPLDVVVSGNQIKSEDLDTREYGVDAARKLLEEDDTLAPLVIDSLIDRISSLNVSNHAFENVLIGTQANKLPIVIFSGNAYDDDDNELPFMLEATRHSDGSWTTIDLMDDSYDGTKRYDDMPIENFSDLSGNLAKLSSSQLDDIAAKLHEVTGIDTFTNTMKVAFTKVGVDQTRKTLNSVSATVSDETDGYGQRYTLIEDENGNWLTEEELEEKEKEKEKEDEVDKTALNSAITAAEQEKEEDYTPESFAELRRALTAAKAVAAAEDATQGDVDDATDALTDAIDALMPKGVDKSELDAAIAEAKKEKKEDYTEESFKKMTDALAEAEEVAADEDATQSEVDTATKKLADALDALVPVKVDKSRLKQALEEAASIKADGYTEDSYKAFTDKVNAGKAVYDDDDATQDEVDAAVQALVEAAKALKQTETKTADYTKVDDALAKIPADLTKYTTDSVELLNKVVASVKRDLPASQQSTVDNYAANILRAIDALELKSQSNSKSDSKTDSKTEEDPSTTLTKLLTTTTSTPTATTATTPTASKSTTTTSTTPMAKTGTGAIAAVAAAGMGAFGFGRVSRRRRR